MLSAFRGILPVLDAMSKVFGVETARLKTEITSRVEAIVKKLAAGYYTKYKTPGFSISARVMPAKPVASIRMPLQVVSP